MAQSIKKFEFDFNISKEETSKVLLEIHNNSFVVIMQVITTKKPNMVGYKLVESDGEWNVFASVTEMPLKYLQSILAASENTLLENINLN